jgi:SAM-dependent methyltransferase/uncharacterized protein YbaR (Trm112 family)
MDKNLLRILRCPFCSGNFALKESHPSVGEIEYAVLSCHCGRYPVVAGIPILKKGNISITHTLDQVIGLIEAGRNREALFAVLMPPSPSSAELAPAWMRAMPAVRGAGRLNSFVGQFRSRGWKQQTEALLVRAVDTASLQDFIDLYYRESGAYAQVFRTGNHDYFSLRLGQPRYLIALALARVVLPAKGPLLDVACGLGHITRQLLRWAEGQPVIGLDQDFWHVYAARHCVAPGAQYICSGADISVPLADGSCSVTFCSDAFHHFMQQVTSVRELKRLVANEGVIVLATIRNGLWKRRYQTILPTLDPEGYKALMGEMPHRIISNDAIMDRYVKKQGPALESQIDFAELGVAPWLSLVAAQRSEVFRDYSEFKEWPHLEGCRLGINPLYTEQGRDSSGNVLLRRVFPNLHYQQENESRNGQYSPETVTVSSKGMKDAVSGNRTPEIEKLIEHGVVLGFPEPERRVKV